jgi:hypothetical protein
MTTGERTEAIGREGSRGGRGRAVRRRTWAALAAATLAASACSLAPGRYTEWTPERYATSGQESSVEVYTVAYDSIADRLSVAEGLAPHDTIGIIVQEPKVVENFEERENLWRRDPKAVESIRRRAWEAGGDAILLGTPEIGRRGLRKMLRVFLESDAVEGHENPGVRELTELTKNPWVAHVAYILRHEAPATGGR